MKSSTLRWLFLAVLILQFAGSAFAHYDPRLGRFLSRDPLREEGGINLYAYCGNDPVNRHDPLGLAEISPNAPSNSAVQNQIEILTGLLPLMQEAALEHNAVDCIGWRPSQWVNSGATGLAVRGQRDFLNRVLKARTAIGANGYGEMGMDKVLYREFGSLDENILPYFEPAGGYAASANTRANLRYIQNTAGLYLEATMMALPLPVPRGVGAATGASRAVALQSRLGPIIDMVPDAAGTLVPAFERQTLELAGRAPMLPASSLGGQLALHQDQLIMNAYQRYYNEEWLKVVTHFDRGRLAIPKGQHWRTFFGQLVDKGARDRLRAYLARQAIPEGPGTDIMVNRWLRDPAGSGAYRIPDLRLMQTRRILDGTIGNKTLSMPQAVDFYNYSGGFDIFFVRPTVGPIP